MKSLLLLFFISAVVVSLPNPQELDPSIVSDVFGKYGGKGYSGVGNGAQKQVLGGHSATTTTVNRPTSQKLVEDNTVPERVSLDLEDEATIEVDSSKASCSSLTADFGYSCVPYYQCRNGTIITDGSGLIDIRNGFGALDAEDSKCPGFLDVCCKDPDFVAPPPKPAHYEAGCGKRNQHGLGVRIQGFTEGESQVGEWPHMCALLKEEIVVHESPEDYVGGDLDSTSVNHFVCGASLISSGALITAAHCVSSFREDDILKVRCGEWDTQTENEPYPHQDRYIGDYVVHPGFKKHSLHNDVAVLFTTADFDMDHNVDTVCLPQPEETFVNEDCFATGWGKDQFGKDGQYQVILKEIDLPVIDSHQCQTSLQQTRLGEKFSLHNSFLCAGGQVGKDTCKGDGGSPLVCPSKRDPTRYVQAGVVAWGIGCGGATPGVYADITKATCFIDQALACSGIPAGAKTTSHFGYSEAACGNWIEQQIAAEVAEIPAGTPSRIVPYIEQSIRGVYTTWANASCEVTYGKAVDIGDKFARQYYGSNQDKESGTDQGKTVIKERFFGK